MVDIRNGAFYSIKLNSLHNPFKYINDFATDLKLVLIAEILTMAFVYLPDLDDSFLRFPLAFLMVMLVPGYVLVATAFPRKGELIGLERLVLSFAVSIAVVPMIGFVLNFTDWGVRLNPMLLSLVLITTVCTLIANKRRNDQPDDLRYDIGLMRHFRGAVAYFSRSTEDLPGKVMTGLLVLSVIGLFSTVAYVIIAPGHQEQFTELYILGPDGKSEGYPVDFYAGHGQNVTVGVVNHEQRAMTYDLRVSLNDGVNHTPLYQDQLTLGQNQSWEKLIELVPGTIGDHQKMEFDLYADGNDTAPYKSVYLWVNVTEMGEKYTGFIVADNAGTPLDNTRWTWRIDVGKNYNISILNHEYRPVTYHYELALQNDTQRTILYSENKTLSHNQTWALRPAIWADRLGNNMLLQFNLYMDGNMTAPYRSVNATVDVYPSPLENQLDPTRRFGEVNS